MYLVHTLLKLRMQLLCTASYSNTQGDVRAHCTFTSVLETDTESPVGLYAVVKAILEAFFPGNVALYCKPKSPLSLPEKGKVLNLYIYPLSVR